MERVRFPPGMAGFSGMSLAGWNKAPRILKLVSSLMLGHGAFGPLACPQFTLSLNFLKVVALPLDVARHVDMGFSNLDLANTPETSPPITYVFIQPQP